MEQISSTTLLINCFFLFLAATLFFKTLALKKKKDHLLRQLTEKNTSIEQMRGEVKDLQGQRDKAVKFQDSLATAELTTQLQKPRISARTSPLDSLTPEKYRLVHTLTQKNMSIDEIGSFLAISSHEAQQLVTLSRLAR